jgi:hypothetical protein
VVAGDQGGAAPIRLAQENLGLASAAAAPPSSAPDIIRRPPQLDTLRLARTTSPRGRRPPPPLPSQSHGVVGCFRFTESYYLLVITRREYVGHVCGEAGARGASLARLRACVGVHACM